MKKFEKLIFIMFILLFQFPILGSPKNKKVHQFADTQWNLTDNSCQICHEILDHPDTNKLTPSIRYTLYDSPTLDAYLGQPDGVSKFCLSCHDGIIADDKGGKIKAVKKKAPSLGADLSDDHPISFVYDRELSLLDGKLFDPGKSLSGIGNTIEKDLLRNNKLQCVSCHDVHGLSGQKYLLVKSNSLSTLCLTCHNK